MLTLKRTLNIGLDIRSVQKVVATANDSFDWIMADC